MKPVRWKQYKPGLQSALEAQSPSHTPHLPAPHPAQLDLSAGGGGWDGGEGGWDGGEGGEGGEGGGEGGEGGEGGGEGGSSLR